MATPKYTLKVVNIAGIELKVLKSDSLLENKMLLFASLKSL